MTPLELAGLINGREYRQEITKEEEVRAKADGLVIVFGESDDLMEFRGAIYDELGVYNGGTAHIDIDGLLSNQCEENCPYFAKLKARAATIKAVFGVGGLNWSYETAVPHETFLVMEEGAAFCRGIVFRLVDVTCLAPSR
jgi:hypothetical protein